MSSLLRVAGRGLYHAVRSRGVTGWYSGIVKKKRAAEVPAVPVRAEDAPEQDPDVIIEQARKAIEAERGKKPEGCVICGEEIAPTSSEGLCWVCRRLKLSAWRDSDTQMSAQE